MSLPQSSLPVTVMAVSERRRQRPAEVVEPGPGEVHETGPVVVVTAIQLPRAAREALAERLGPGHVIVDMRDAGPAADVVLVPPASRQLIGALREHFPDAQLLVTEFTDAGLGIDFQGPVGRAIESGVDGYFVVPAMDDLATITYRAGQAKMPPAISAPQSRPRIEITQAKEPAARLLLKTATESKHGTIEIDLKTWAHAVELDSQEIAELAWPVILQILSQGFDVSAVGVDERKWRDLAAANGIDVSRV